MKPTRAPGTSESTASSIPTPARRMGQTATFLPEIRRAVVRSSGVSISISSSARSFVASYVSRSVSSLTSWRNICVVVVTSRRSPSLCWTSGWSTSVTLRAADVLGVAACDIRRVPPKAGIERAAIAERPGAGPQRVEVRILGERVDDDPADLFDVVLVEAADRDGLCPDAHAGGHGRRTLVERHGVPVRRDPHPVKALLRVLSGPVGRAQVDLQQVRVGAAREQVEPACEQRLGQRVGVGADLLLVAAELFR